MAPHPGGLAVAFQSYEHRAHCPPRPFGPTVRLGGGEGLAFSVSGLGPAPCRAQGTASCAVQEGPSGHGMQVCSEES